MRSEACKQLVHSYSAALLNLVLILQNLCRWDTGSAVITRRDLFIANAFDRWQLKALHTSSKTLNPLECRDNYSATSNNNEVGTLAVDGRAVTFGTARRGLGGAAVPNVKSHPSTASVLITVMLYIGPLLSGYNMPIKGQSTCIC